MTDASPTVLAGRRRLRERKPVRVYRDYLGHRGPLLAAGLSQLAVFAVFAAVWVAFTSFGLFAPEHSRLRDALLHLVDALVPGLIDTGAGGAIDPASLVTVTVLSWTGAIALVSLAFTAVGWLSAARDAVLLITDLPAPGLNLVLLWIKDLVMAAFFGGLLLASAALSVSSSGLLDDALDALGIRESAPAMLSTRIVSVALVFVLDLICLALLYRVLADVHIPMRYLLRGSAFGALAMGVLQLVGSYLLDLAPDNPLLASFTVIAGLLLWFALASRVVLLAACWMVVSMRDDRVPLPGRLRLVAADDDEAEAAPDVGAAD